MMKVPLSEALFASLFAGAAHGSVTETSRSRRERRLHASVKSVASSADTRPGKKKE